MRLTPAPPKVFISYSHDTLEHRDRVLELADRLRGDGIEASLDQYEPAPSEGWPRWMEQQIEQADFVLTVCTETYSRRFSGQETLGHGLGATWEGNILTQSLYESGARNSTFLPVIFSAADVEHIPRLLRPATYYRVDNDPGYEQLYRRLTSQPEVVPPPLGKRRVLPPRHRNPPGIREPMSSGAPKSQTATAGSGALALWREKRDFLREQEAITADPAQKFALKKQIEEAERKIQEFSN